MPSEAMDHRRRSRSPPSRARREKARERERSAEDGEHRHRSHHRERGSGGDGREHRHHRHKPKRTRPTAASMMSDNEDDSAPQAAPRELPLGARMLSRHGDYEVFEPVFAHYLDLHEQVDIAELSGRELRRRWKSFVRRWNAGQLSEGWYDPETFARVAADWAEISGDAQERAARVAAATGRGQPPPPERLRVRGASPEGAKASRRDDNGNKNKDDDDNDDDNYDNRGQRKDEEGDVDEDDDDGEDDYVPPLPPPAGAVAGPGFRALGGRNTRQGPGIPSLQELEARRAEEADSRGRSWQDVRLARRADLAEQKERLDELLPRAAAGTRERQLEKRRLLNEKMRGFREGSAGATEEAGDSMLMGDGADDYRAALAREQRKKSDRDVRREEEARAKAEELRQRMQRYQEREEKTIGALRELARQRFGD